MSHDRSADGTTPISNQPRAVGVRAVTIDDGRDAVAMARCVIRDTGRLPHPGAGETVRRWQALADLAADDLSVARLVEGHHDALAILQELGAEAPSDPGLLGVWAARPGELAATRHEMEWRLDGAKPFCSGSSAIDLALVTAVAEDGPRLFLLPGDAGSPDPSSWRPLGMEATRSVTMHFAGVEVAGDAVVGGPGAYVERPGFGHGGCGVAACWWGGATALLRDVRVALAGRPGPLQAQAYGRAALAVDGTARVLREAAAAIDAAPTDLRASTRWAAVCRSVSASACREVLSLASAHLGTSVLATRPDVSARLTDLVTYLTQFHDDTFVEVGERLLDEELDRLC